MQKSHQETITTYLTKKELNEFVRTSQTNPVLFNKVIWNNWSCPYDKQWDIWDNVCKYRRTAVKSAHGVGKSFIAARIALHWTLTRPNSILVATAPTARQIEKVLFGEIHRQYHHAQLDLGGKLLQMELRIAPDWYLIGVATQSTSSTDIGSKMQGFHAVGGVMCIIDEAANVSSEVFGAAESITTGEKDKILVIGNPTDPNSKFAQCFKAPPPDEYGGWSKMTITAFDVCDLGIPGLISRDWVEDKRVSWGEESPSWKAKVLGEFPELSEDDLIGYKYVEAALQRRVDDLKDPVKERCLGIDVARFGNDASVGYSLVDGVAKLVFKIHKQDISGITARVDQYLRNEEPFDRVIIDADGLGGGLVDNLKSLKHKNIVGVHSGSNPRDRKKFFDKRTEMAFNLRDRFTAGNIILDNETTGSELSTLKYVHKVKSGFGVFKIEAKEDTKKRLGRSPDCGDALIYASAGNILSNPINIRYF